MDPLLIVLRVLHIGAGVLWVGAAWMLFFFITPTLHALGADTQRAFTDHILRRQRLALTILIATVVAVGAGLILLWIDINRYGAELWFSTGFGIGITIGALAALASFILGPTLIIPLSNRLEKLAAQRGEDGGPTPTEEFDRVARRLRTTLMWDSGLLIVAVTLMATARYL